jgi:hypothetical protein
MIARAQESPELELGFKSYEDFKVKHLFEN